MTLLKAYLLGTKDPFVLAKVFYEEELLKSSDAVDRLINKELGWNWEEEVKKWKNELFSLEGEIGLADLKIQENINFKEHLQVLLNMPKDFVPPKMKTKRGWRSGYEEISDEKEYERLVQDNKPIPEKFAHFEAARNRKESGGYSGKYDKVPTEFKKIPKEELATALGEVFNVIFNTKKLKINLEKEIKIAEEELEKLENKRDKVSLAITSKIEGGLTWQQLKDANKKGDREALKVKYLIHNLGLEILQNEKKGIENLISGNLAEVMTLDYPDKIKEIEEKYENNLKNEKGPSRVKLWKDFEKELLEEFNKIIYEQTGKPGLGKTHPYYKERKYSQKLKSLNVLIGNSEERLKEIYSKFDIRLDNVEEVLSDIKETTVKDKNVIDSQKTATPAKEINFSTKDFWENFIDSSSKGTFKTLRTNKNQAKKALKLFLEAYEQTNFVDGDNEKPLNVTPNKVQGDPYGVHLDTDKKHNPKINWDRRTRLNNLETLKTIFEEFPSELKSNRSVVYILEIIDKEISKEKTSIKKPEKKQQSANNELFDRLLKSLKRSYESIEHYHSGKYPNKFISFVSKIKKQGMDIETLKELFVGEKDKETKQIKVPNRFKDLNISKDRLNKAKRQLNSKTRTGKTLLYHITNIWDNKEVDSFGVVDKDSLEALNDGIKLMEDSLNEVREARKNPAFKVDPYRRKEGKVDNETFMVELEETTNELMEFLEEVEKAIDDDLTSEELLKLSTEYKRVGMKYKSFLLKLNHIPTRNDLGRNFAKINNAISQIFGGPALDNLEPLNVVHEKLPHQKRDYLYGLVTGIRNDVRGWEDGKNDKFIINGKPWNKSQMRNYVEALIPPADSSLLDPRLHSDYKPVILGKIRKQRSGLIDKILADSLLDDKDTNWIYTQTGRQGIIRQKGKKPYKQMMGHYDEKLPTGGRYASQDETTESDELTHGQAKKLFGEHGHKGGYKGDSKKDIEDSEEPWAIEDLDRKFKDNEEKEGDE